MNNFIAMLSITKLFANKITIIYVLIAYKYIHYLSQADNKAPFSYS